MPTTFFLVRAVVAEPLRQTFDHWYSVDHLQWAIKIFKCQKAWHFWSELEPGVHYAVYRFADRAACDAALATDEFKEMVADFNRAFPSVTRTRDIVTLAEEREGS